MWMSLKGNIMTSNYRSSNLVIKLNTKKQRSKIILFGVLIFSLWLSYCLVLSPMYSYSHLTYRPNVIKFAISIICVIVTLLGLPSDSERPSTFLYYIFYTVTYIPTVTYFWLNDQPTLYLLYETICFFIIAAILRRKVNGLQIATHTAIFTIQLILIVYILSSLLLVVQNGGIHLNAIISDLYLVRSENKISGFSGYLLNWCAKSFMPFFFVYFYIKKKWIGVLITCILQVLLFVSFGFKAFLMAIMMLIGISYLMRTPESFNRTWMIVLITGNILCTLCAKYITPKLINIFTYRTLFLPAQGQFEYYDFFTHNDFLFFSEGSIGKLLGMQYPYTESIGRVVNSYIFAGAKISNGNTGALSYGFADLGFCGMLLAAVTISIIFLIVDSITKKMPVLIPVCAMSYQIFALNDNNVLICLNTGGIFWTIIVLMLLNSVYAHLIKERFLEEKA